MIIDTEAIRAALLSPDLTIGSGIGTARIPGRGKACTIAEINLVLTGKLTDGPHPCMSETIRRWVIRVQDAMPADMRNAPAWREAAVGIAGSAADRATEDIRRDLIISWMWDALGDEAVLATVPDSVQFVWQRMLQERTCAAAGGAADAAYAAADDADAAADAAAAAAYAADAAANAAAYAAAAAAANAYAADAAYANAYAADAADAADAYWKRRNPAALLVKLIEARA